jgi:hypothetical protein
MMLHLSSVMRHGASSNGDQMYAAHVLVGEPAGSWFGFVCDAQPVTTAVAMAQ